MDAGAIKPGHETAARASALLDAWEHGQLEMPGERALMLLVAAGDPGLRREDLEALTVGARDRHLLALRRDLFGATVDAIVTCPKCAESVDLRFDVDDIIVGDADPSDASVEVETESGTLRVRLPTAGDVAVFQPRADPVQALAALLDRVVMSAGSGPRPSVVLSTETVELVSRALAAADPQADVSFDVTCPACQEGFEAPFDAVAFVWAELSDWAGRMLGDVHSLALAYGWREQDVLSLSPGRRRFYLEAVGA